MRLRFLFYAAAAVIAIVGILHIIEATEPEHIEHGTLTIFFLVAGTAQIFWALPTVKRWASTWHYTGIAGTIVLIILWSLTRLPNPITGGEAEPIDEIGITVQILHASYIALIATAIIRQKHMMKIDHRTAAYEA
ncbi:MAG: hypothetical protein M3299_02075 [Thermoproteota archaeon]|nr:hypothetical protein [Thermoproteota archaeon]